MSSTVRVGSWNITSNNESAEEMVKALKPEKSEDPKQPKPIRDRGKDVDSKPEKPAPSVVEAGRKGGEAAAKAREEKAKEDAKTADKEAADAKDAAPAKDREGKSAEDTEPAADAKAAKGVEPEAKPAEEQEEHPSRAKARIEQLARERAEARRDAFEARQAKQELENRLAALEAKAGGVQKQSESQAAPDDDPEPTADNYADWAEFNKDQAKWAARQEFKRQEQERNRIQYQQAQARYFQQQQKQFVDKVEAAKESDPEIVDRIDPELMELLETTPPGQNPTPSSTIADEVFQSDYPAQILAYFTDHPDEVRRLAGLPNVRSIAREIAKLETRFAGGTGQEEPPARSSSAPPPLRPLVASAQPSEVDLTGDIPFDRFLELKRKKRAR